jgi:hypothetical protein
MCIYNNTLILFDFLKHVSPYGWMEISIWSKTNLGHVCGKQTNLLHENSHYHMLMPLEWAIEEGFVEKYDRVKEYVV